VGCTHTSIALAVFLARLRFRVAITEFNDNPVFYTLEDEKSGKGMLKNCFRRSGVDFFKKDTRPAEVLRAGYEYIVLDLGRLGWSNEKGFPEKSSSFEEMHRADLQILVAGAAVWQLKDLAPFISENLTDYWNIVFRTPEPGIFSGLQAELPHRIHAMVFAPDPFKGSPELNRLFTCISGPVLPVTPDLGGD